MNNEPVMKTLSHLENTFNCANKKMLKFAIVSQ